MTAFSYAPKQQDAILAALKIQAGIRPREIAAAVTKSAQKAIDDDVRNNFAPEAVHVIDDLAKIKEQARYLASTLRDVKADMDDTPAALRTLRAMMRKRSLDIPPTSLVDGLHALVEACDMAQRELRGDGLFGSPFMLDGVLTYREASARKSRRGRPPNTALKHFASDMAFIFQLATGARPTTPKRKGTVYGPFCSFLEAAVRPTGLLPQHRGLGALATAARKEHQVWLSCTASSDDAEGMSEDDLYRSVAARLGITWPTPDEVVTKFPAKHAN